VSFLLSSLSHIHHPVAEAYILNLKENRWEKVKYRNDAPQQRLLGQCAMIGNKMWLVGGWDSSAEGTSPMGVILDDCWTLDVQTWTWEKQTIKGEAIPDISRFQMKAIGSKLWIHHHRCKSHILVLDTKTLTATNYPVTGDVPSSRGLHAMANHGDHLYIFGGQGGDDFFKELFSLDTTTLKWSLIGPDQFAGKPPGPRCAVASAVMADSILFYGGASKPLGMATLKDCMLGDLVIFDLVTLTWTWPVQYVSEGTSRPAPRNAHAICSIGEEVILVGGWKAFDKTYNDVWRLAPKKRKEDIDWGEDDYVLMVWLLGSIVSILLLLIPGVPEGFWMIPAPFIPLTLYKGIPKLLYPTTSKGVADDVDQGAEEMESKKTK